MNCSDDVSEGARGAAAHRVKSTPAMSNVDPWCRVATPTITGSIRSRSRSARDSSRSWTNRRATFPYPIYSKWFSEYNKLHPNVEINYQSIGSGGGIRQITNRTVFFGATDGPMTQDQLLAAPGKILHFPTVLGADVPVYNVAGVSSALNLADMVLPVRRSKANGRVTITALRSVSSMDVPSVMLPPPLSPAWVRARSMPTSTVWVISPVRKVRVRSFCHVQYVPE